MYSHDNTAKTLKDSNQIIVAGLGIKQDLRATFPLDSEVTKSLLQADYLVAGSRHLKAIKALYPELRANLLTIDVQLDVLIEKLVTLHKDKKRLFILASGDPLFYGIASSLIERKAFSAEDLHIIPNISSLQMACAKIGLPSCKLSSCSLHGRNNSGGWLSLAHLLPKLSPIAILNDLNSSPSALAEYMTERGYGEDYLLNIFENLGVEGQEKYLQYSPEEAMLAEKNGSYAPCFPQLVILLPKLTKIYGQNTNNFHPHIGIADSEFFQEGGVITKSTQRAAILSALSPRTNSIVWDLGAGCGSISIEACALAHTGTVYAIEENAKRVQLITENRRKFKAANLEIVNADWHNFLRDEQYQDIKDPDCIIIGGGLGGSATKARKAIVAAWEKLAPGGNLVISCVLLSTLEVSRATLQELSGNLELSCIQVSHSAALGSDLHLKAQNPVFVLKAQKNSRQGG